MYCEGLFNRVYCVMCEKPAFQCPLIGTLSTSISVRPRPSVWRAHNSLQSKRASAHQNFTGRKPWAKLLLEVRS
jgi:hypothetical protein